MSESNNNNLAKKLTDSMKLLSETKDEVSQSLEMFNKTELSKESVLNVVVSILAYVDASEEYHRNSILVSVGKAFSEK